MQQSDWLSYKLQWLQVMYRMATFSRFSVVSEEHLETLLDN